MINILVLCTGNSARSLLAEALFNAHGSGRLKAWSAGSKPTGHPNPYALDILAANGHATRSLRSKSWEEFSGDSAPEMAAVITVCDSAASEVCPIWPGAPVQVHWGVPDPAGIEPDDAARAAFAQTYQRFEEAVRAVMAAPDLETAHALKSALEAARP